MGSDVGSSKAHPRPPILTARVVVVSDFNCPYCFTLNEWLSELGVASQVRWLGVEHRPDLPLGAANREADSGQLALEVADVGRRAPEVGVRTPRTWCNSRPALLLQNAVEVDAPEEAAALRRRIFRAYWRDGVPLCDDDLLAREQSLFPDVDPLAETDELDRVTTWWRTHVDRIPAMFAPTGVVHLGLQTRETVQRFVLSAIADAPPGPGCA
jgi:hypothetical protein